MTGLTYLDYAASTPIDPRVVTRMAPYHGAASYTHPQGDHLNLERQLQ